MISIIQAAGWPIWPLIFCSIVALGIVVERALFLRVKQVAPNKLIDNVLMAWHKSGQNAALKACGTSPLGRILAAALAPTLNTLAKSKGSGSFFDAGAVPQNGQGLKGLRETVLANEGRRQVARLNQYLGALAAIASAAPLLGLLGTVVGMIEMFVAQAAGSSADPSALAGGIAVALYNTAFGLIVAIPALLLWRVLKSKVNALQLHMELEAARFLRFSPNETE